MWAGTASDEERGREKVTMAAAGRTVKFTLPEGSEERYRESENAQSPNTLHPKRPGTPPKPRTQPSSLSSPSLTGGERQREEQPRPQSRPSSQQTCTSREDSRTPQRHTPSTTREHSREHSASRQRRRKQSNAAREVHAVRERTNSASREQVRSLKYSVARLRESLLKVEEEVKMMARGRRTLEMAVQDVRRAISVNQQSVSMQQKKTRAEMDSTLHLLREESQTLSKAKSQVEQCLRSVKGHMQSLDCTRRTLQTKISSLSQSLELDAQRFKVYYAGGSRFKSVCEAPVSHNGSRQTDEAIATVCCQAGELVAKSRDTRQGIEGLIVSIQTQKSQAHQKVIASVAHSVQEANTKKRDMLLERGQVRLSQNSAHHQQHTEEILLGRVLGPVSDRHRSVSEKVDRPLSRRRPGSSQEERTDIKRTTSKLAKRLSVSAVQVAETQDADQSLSRQLRRYSLSSNLDSHTLRIRKMSLDNRWVQ